MRKKQKRSPLHKIAIFAVALIFLYGGYYFGNRLGTKHPHYQTLLPDQQLTTLSLPDMVDHNGSPFTLSHLENRWSLIFLGSSAENSDTGTLLTLTTQIRNRLASTPELQKKLQTVVIFPSPAETSEKIKTTVTSHGRSSIGITGSKESLTRLAHQLGIKLILNENEEDGTPVYSNSIILVDPNAHRLGLIAGRVTPADIAADIRMAEEKHLTTLGNR
jgi:cytochrome oxidase Cu insertion factor (SCO1/SenC/PrrC family)